MRPVRKINRRPRSRLEAKRIVLRNKNRGGPLQQQAESQLQSELESETAYRRAHQARTDSSVKPEAIYHLPIRLQPPKPNNLIQSKKHPGIGYSGIVVQVVRNNPIQLINPFAPDKYGDGEVNITRNPSTHRAEGLKVFQISF